MSDVSIPRAAIERVRALATAFVETDLVRLRVARGDTEVEFRRSTPVSRATGDGTGAAASRNGSAGEPAAEPARLGSSADRGAAVAQLETIKADLVGIFRLSRPAPKDGERLEGDRELAYVEALGIRNPVRSRGKGRIVNVLCQEGAAVEYGQPLFEIDRT